MSLHEYVSFNLPRTLVQRAVDALDQLGVTSGTLGELLDQLRRGLDRDRHRKALDEIQDELGDLGPGELLEEILAAIRRPPANLAGSVSRLRSAIRVASERVLYLAGEDLGVPVAIGEPVEIYRLRVLAWLGDAAAKEKFGRLLDGSVLPVVTAE